MKNYGHCNYGEIERLIEADLPPGYRVVTRLWGAGAPPNGELVATYRVRAGDPENSIYKMRCETRAPREEQPK